MTAANAFDLAVFDYDGTLCDTRLAIAHCIERAFARRGRSCPPRAALLAVVSRGLPLVETCLCLDPALRERHALEEMVATYRGFYRGEGEALVEMFPGAVPTLRLLHARGVKCLVISNKGAEAVNRSLARHHMAAVIDRVCAEQPGRPAKPDPALFADLVRPHYPAIGKERMLMIGDTEVDIVFAKRAGIASCWAAYGFGDSERCLALAPDYCIECIEALPAVFAGGAKRR